MRHFGGITQFKKQNKIQDYIKRNRFFLDMKSNSSTSLYSVLIKLPRVFYSILGTGLKRGIDKIPELNGVGCICSVPIEFDKWESDVCRADKEYLKSRRVDYTDDPKNQGE